MQRDIWLMDLSGVANHKCKFLSGVAPCSSRYICWCGERDMWRPIAPGKVSIVPIFCSNALTLYCVFLFPHPSPLSFCKKLPGLILQQLLLLMDTFGIFRCPKMGLRAPQKKTETIFSRQHPSKMVDLAFVSRVYHFWMRNKQIQNFSYFGLVF